MSRGVVGLDTYFLDMVEVLREIQTSGDFDFLTGFDSCDGPLGGGGLVCAARSQSEQNRFIFNDAVHLTTAANSIVAENAIGAVLRDVPIAPVPLPAPALALLTGLASLFAMRSAARRA